jgi:hypothetical protein
LSTLEHHCNNNQLRNTKNYTNIIKAWHGILLLGIDKDELKNKSANMPDGKRIFKDSGMVIAGSPNAILNEINKYIDVGVPYFTIYFPDLPNIRSLRLFADHIIPCFKNK